MDEFINHRKYESFKIPDQQQGQKNRTAQDSARLRIEDNVSLDDQLFYVMELDSGTENNRRDSLNYSQNNSRRDAAPIPQKIKSPEQDDIRTLFYAMRDISRNYRSAFDYTRFFDKRVQPGNTKIFYEQAKFMRSFSDNYTDFVTFSSYFPSYQMMGYEQLRTYFTWRTQVRNGNVTDISVSYAFLYIYELLNNVGVDNPQDGLDKLMFFWKAFRVYNRSIDRYVIRWLKDYHIYYELSHSFKTFVETNNLSRHYPHMADPEDNFDLFCSVSKYDIKKSAFFADDNIKLITDCFYFVMDQLKQLFISKGISLEDFIFQPTQKRSVWQPFKDALFYPWMKQPDRRVVLSENEIYLCQQNNWVFSTVITMESGRQFVGYLMKQIESVLRQVVKYKYKLTANINMISSLVLDKLDETGLSLEKTVYDATIEFYRETTKTVVSVDLGALSKIRQEALVIQEKLTVPEREETQESILSEIQDLILPEMQKSEALEEKESISPQIQISISPQVQTFSASSDIWSGLKNILDDVEIDALSTVIHRQQDIKQFADEHGIMLEVLIDGINEKAMDCIGDNLMDEEFTIYDDYIDQIKEMVG